MTARPRPATKRETHVTEHRLWRWIGAGLVAAATLGACGGGGGASYASSGGGVGTGGTGISFGTVTGFGSVVLDGKPYNSATPNYYADGETGEHTPSPATAVELGDRLSITLDASGNPSSVVIEPELIGAVGSIGSNTFTVNGVAVRVNANATSVPPTYYAGLAGFGGLIAGMQVEVHGAFGIDGSGNPYVQATLVQQLPSTSTAVRITGLVSGLDAAAQSFVVDGLTVHYDSGTSVTPSGAALSNGALVNVWSASPPSGSVLAAGSIRVRTLQGSSGSVQLGGLVMQLAGTAFSVSGIPVDGSALASSVAALRNGEYVVVDGTVDAAGGTVRAASISAFPTTIELKGTITGFVDAGNFLVRGVPVDASAATFAAGASAASLGNGVYVDVIGTLGASNVVGAGSVSVLAAPPADGIVDYQGTVSNVTASGFTLSYTEDGNPSSAQVTLAANVQYSNGSAAQLVDGARVEIEATDSGSGLSAFSVSFQKVSESGSGQKETKGIVYAYTTGPTGQAGSSFMVNGLTITLDTSSTVSGGTLGNGVHVDVTFTPGGGQNVASQVEIEN